MNQKDYKTPQEIFWDGQFGSDYILRNNSDNLLAANLNLFSKALKQAGKISSCIEFGANVGMNLKALKLLYPGIELNGIEINHDAAVQLNELIGRKNVFEGSILEYPVNSTYDIALVKGVLIHINPEMLPIIYEKLYYSASQYVLVCEYYNPFPASISYRGHSDKLFKRDFAGEMLDLYPSLSLIDYGFAYRRDPAFPQDDITWFLMKKGK